MHPPERIDPGAEPPGVVAHHAAKYHFAGRMSGSDALDVGCGLGYGTRLLKDRFVRVIGVDLSEEAVGIARSRYSDSGCSFAVMDAGGLGFQDHGFDLVTCFEVIEHLTQPDKHLAHAARLLRAGGTYLVSTPVPGTGGSPAENPFHQHEFTKVALTQLLSAHFSTVSLFTQAKRRSRQEMLLNRLDVFNARRLPFLRSAIRRVSARSSIVASEDATVEDFAISPGETPDATEFVAVCRDPFRHGA